MGKNNHHHKSFTETDSKLIFSTIESCVGYSLTNLIIDEAAFIEKMEIYWESLQPYISTVANCMIISTHNVDNNWFKKTLNNAETKENNFNIIKLNYFLKLAQLLHY